MNNIFEEGPSNSIFRRLQINYDMFNDEVEIKEITNEFSKMHREQVMQDRENMSKFLNNKYNKRRLK